MNSAGMEARVPNWLAAARWTGRRYGPDGPSPIAASGSRSPALTIFANWRHRITTRSAEPTNPNQNGAVIPNSRASRPPIGVPMAMPAQDRDAIDAPDPAQELVRHRPLANDGRGRSPDEGVGAEDDQRGEGHGAECRQGEDEVRPRLDEQPDPHDVRPSENRRSSRP